MAEYRSLLEELAQNITPEDLEQLKSACREDIPSGEGDAIATGHHWFAFLERHSKLDRDNLSYIEHIFEISRRPDLLTKVVAVPHAGAQDLRGGRGGHQAHAHPQRQEVQG
ncbi:unnamed protein product [Coccothraustes coccothraustes]